MKLLKLISIISTLVVGSLYYSNSYAVISIPLTTVKKTSTWTFKLNKFKTSLTLPVTDSLETVEFSRKKIKKRLRKSATDVRVEPLTFTLRNNQQQMRNTAKRYAKKGKAVKLFNYLNDTIKNSKAIRPGSESKAVTIDKQAYKLIDSKKFAAKFNKTHHNLSIDSKKLNNNEKLSKELLKQLQPYLNEKQRKTVLNRIQNQQEIPVDRDILPAFARKMVKKFTIYRGPNCFHAALAFQNMSFTNSVRFNVKVEKNYHRAMINYDELWRTLQSEFYEVDLEQAPVKYGDIIVFFEVPSKNPGPVNFKWIRHTAAYLFGNYTFSKGSKSSNTPYTVKTLEEEWNTWKGYTDLMGVKVFRKSGRSVKKSPAKNLIDWMY